MTAGTANTVSTSQGSSSRPLTYYVLKPGIILGIILGVVAAIVCGTIVSRVWDGNPDGALVAAYAGWAVFFMVGMGAFNGIWEWGWGHQEPTFEEEMDLAGKDQGLWRYFRFTTDHKVVGIQYLITVLILFTIGASVAFMIRLEQSQTGAKYFSPSTYNTLVGLHGIVMIITTIVMISGSFGNFVLPIMVGARDMAFPRLNALSYWLFFLVIPVLLSTLFTGGFPTGWTGYAPLADQAQLGMDAYSFTIVIFGLSVTVAGMNIVTTVALLRAKGMSWGRLPILVWAVTLSVLLGLIAFPTFILVQSMVLMDRVLQTSFFINAGGGSNWLYEHLFWFMGHPEVYVIILPAFGVVAEVAAVFCRKPVFAYPLLVGSMIGVFVLSVTVWAHHLYFSGANTAMDGPFMLSTELISIPTGVIFFVLVGTFWRGRIWVEAPLLFVLGMLTNFIIGGVTGLYLADVPTDVVFHGGMFVTAHFHFTLVGGGVFGFFGAFYYWFPKIFGRRLDPLLSKLHFYLFEVGFVGTFVALFYAGLHGEPRWQANVPVPFGTANFIASLFAILIAASVVVAAYNIISALVAGEPADANEWGGTTLEWQVPTPVPLLNFEHIPVIESDPYTYGHPELTEAAAEAEPAAKVLEPGSTQ
jgi:cytochrome c oxidase subunit I